MPTPWDKTLPAGVRFRNIAIIVGIALLLLCCLCAGLQSFVKSYTPEGQATATARAIPTATKTPVPTATSAPTWTPAPPTATPVPTNSPTPRPPTATPAPTGTPEPFSWRFGEGMKVVGTDIAPGTYRAVTTQSCYWKRMSGFGGELGDIIANSNSTGSVIVTIAPSDKGFMSSRCGTWTRDLSPITASPTAPFSEGMFFVGKDIAAGTWRTDNATSCYWKRMSGFGGDLDDIIANSNAQGATVIVAIAPTDAGFYSARCGTWKKAP